MMKAYLCVIYYNLWWEPLLNSNEH